MRRRRPSSAIVDVEYRNQRHGEIEQLSPRIINTLLESKFSEFHRDKDIMKRPFYAPFVIEEIEDERDDELQEVSSTIFEDVPDGDHSCFSEPTELIEPTSVEQDWDDLSFGSERSVRTILDEKEETSKEIQQQTFANLVRNITRSTSLFSLHVRESSLRIGASVTKAASERKVTQLNTNQITNRNALVETKSLSQRSAIQYFMLQLNNNDENLNTCKKPQWLRQASKDLKLLMECYKDLATVIVSGDLTKLQL